MTKELGYHVQNQRQLAGMTQEELAHAAGLSPSTVRKLEQGGSVRMETLHMLARALGTETSALMTPGSPEPKEVNDAHSIRVMELRKVLLPPIGLGAPFPPTGEEPNLRNLRNVTRVVTRSYFEDDYSKLADKLPDLMRDVNSAVAYFGHGPEHEEALAIRIEALRMAGRYLTQVREDDLAYQALSRLISDAQALGRSLDAAAGISSMCWLFLRQARFTESTAMATSIADEIEPPKISKASADHLATWGWAYLRAVAGAVRNNQYDIAEEALRMARSAATAIGREVQGAHQAGVSFGPVTTAMIDIEVSMAKGDARSVLENADKGVLSYKARQKLGTPHRNGWNRHRLDVAMAKQRLGLHQEATMELRRIMGSSPDWLAHQRMAKDIMRDLYRKRKRALTSEMREVGAFLALDR
ncbi:helix-turn-helix domain-containing protein [Streptomyces carpaticus]|uniref:Helix-turn-helix domain-containing protein n=1 Tax=Streptomyces carpaticus TaxID=285558 RepID=A0ABV4ZRQ7_9ACTN